MTIDEITLYILNEDKMLREGWVGTTEFIKMIGREISNYQRKQSVLGKVTHAKYSGDVMMAVSGAILVAAIIVVVNKVYKRYLSDAAKACKNSADKTKCMAEYRIKGHQNKITSLRSSKSLCNKTKDSAKCNSKIDKEIISIESKIKKLKGKMQAKG